MAQGHEVDERTENQRPTTDTESIESTNIGPVDSPGRILDHLKQAAGQADCDGDSASVRTEIKGGQDPESGSLAQEYASMALARAGTTEETNQLRSGDSIPGNEQPTDQLATQLPANTDLQDSSQIGDQESPQEEISDSSALSGDTLGGDLAALETSPEDSEEVDQTPNPIDPTLESDPQPEFEETSENQDDLEIASVPVADSDDDSDDVPIADSDDDSDDVPIADSADDSDVADADDEPELEEKLEARSEGEDEDEDKER